MSCEIEDSSDEDFSHYPFVSSEYRSTLARRPIHRPFQMDSRRANLQVPSTHTRSRSPSCEQSEDNSDSDDNLSSENELSQSPTFRNLRKRLQNIEGYHGDSGQKYQRLPAYEDRHRMPKSEDESRFREEQNESYQSLSANSNRHVRCVSRDAVPSENQTMTIILGILFAILLCGVLGFLYLNHKTTTESLPDNDFITEHLTNNIQTIHDKFPSQIKKIWNSFYAGIKKVLLEKPTEPSVFLLIYNGTEKTSSCLAREFAQAAHTFLNTSKPDPLIVDGESLGKNKTLTSDYGHLIMDYRPLVEEHRIMILNNLHLVPATLARGLHIFCDNITPLVHEAVYIFTLNISEGNDKGNPTKIAETELYSIWNQLDNDILSPLIARITSGYVFKIHPEEGTNTFC